MQFSSRLLILSVVGTQSVLLTNGHKLYEIDTISDNVVATTKSSEITTTLQSLLGLDNNSNDDKQQQELESFHRQLQQQQSNNNNNNNNIIINSANTTMTCASAFVSCQLTKSCNECIQSQVNSDILFGVSSTTKCDTILTSLQRKKLCTDISNDLDMSIFCAVFTLCTQNKQQQQQQEEPIHVDGEGYEIIEEIDCTILTECNWPGFKANYIGDGVCNEYTPNSCYNTPICQYDGGDCCSDTCIDVANRTATFMNNNNYNDRSVSLYPCGIDGYYCRNVYSSDCNNLLTNGKCKNTYGSSSTTSSSGSTSKSTTTNNKVTCTDGRAMYRVLMYDSFGDGWDSTNLTIRIKDNNNIVFNDQLQYGAYDVKYLCLNPLQPTCYDVTLIGGTWGKEISWEIRGMNAGSPTIAYGGSPMTCTFGTAGISTSTCPNTCLGMDDDNKKASNSYKSLKSLQQCINDKCYLQSDACVADNVCKNCFQDPVPDSCYTSSSFIALSDCAICKCTNDDKDTTDYCKNKLTPDEKIAVPEGSTTGTMTQDKTYIGCSANDKITSGDAVMMYTQCTNFTSDVILHQLFDNDNFGPLDNFEQCANDFKNNKDGTKTALGCTQILYNAMYPDPTYNNNIDSSTTTSTYHPEAIAELAKELFYNYEGFCDCSKVAYTGTSAACDGYSNFKTLLKESIDACFAMDSIDCAAWNEFARPCQANIKNKFKEIDFTLNQVINEQCYYVQYESCGGVGKFPTFTRLLDDCKNHVDATSWEFYQNYYSNCLANQIPKEDTASSAALLPWEPKQAPTNSNNNNNVVPAPTKADSSSTSSTTTKNILTSAPSFLIAQEPVKSPVAKEYVPPDEKQSSGGSTSTYVSPDDPKKKSNWFRNMIVLIIIGFIGYHVYVRRHYLSSYQQLNTGTTVGNIALTILNTIMGLLGHIPIIGRYFGGGNGGGFMGSNNTATRSHGGNNYSFSNMSDPDEMYSGLSLESSLSNSMMMTSSTGGGMFQPTTLPPGPTTFMGNHNNNNNTTGSGNYAI